MQTNRSGRWWVTGAVFLGAAAMPLALSAQPWGPPGPPPWAASGPHGNAAQEPPGRPFAAGRDFPANPTPPEPPFVEGCPPGFAPDRRPMGPPGFVPPPFAPCPPSP